MKTPTRPVGVPEAAVWAEKDKCWELGTSEKRGFLKKVEVPVGEWHYWREDGSLWCIANFDFDGNQHGVVERFHNDGTLASRGEWKNGNRHGHFVFIQSENKTDESYSASDNTWRYEFESTANWEEHNLRWFLKDGTECTSDGRPLADAYDLDQPILDSNPTNFLQTDAKEISELLDPSRKKLKPEKDPHQLEELWGFTVPEIDAFVNHTAKSEPFVPVTDRRKFEKNIWESLIAHPWENINEELGMAFVGATKICYLSDSDHAYATIFQPRMEEPAPNAVIMWDHDTHYINEVLSLSLDEFAYRAAVSSAFQEERLSKKAAQKAWQKLEGKCYVGYFLSEGLDESDDGDERDDANEPDDEVETGGAEGNKDSFDREKYRVDLEPEFIVTGRFWRAHWIIELLRADKERDWGTVKECFRPGWNKPLDEVYESLKRSGNERIYPTALYLLWRLFWFDQQSKLKECCELYRNHPARMVRDLVALLEEIGNGRKQIGDIKDIIAVRDEFLSLDLSPERREAREQEVAQKAEVETQRVKAIADETDKLVKIGLTAILDRAWASVTDVGAIAEYEKAARKFGGNEIQWKCFDWVNNGLYRRDHIDATDEAEGVGIWLGQNGCETLQPFVWAAVYNGHFQTADLLLPSIGKTEGALDSRLIDCCLKQLDVPEEYNIVRTLAVELLGITGVSSIVPRLCKLVDEYFEEIGNKQDFEARLAAIPWESLLVETAKALEKLVTTNKEHGALVRKTLKKLLEHAAKEYQHNLCAPVLNALVAWGETDLLPLIGKLLRANDTTIQVAALRALETLAAKLDPKARRNFVAMEFRNPSDVDNAVTLMYYRAANALISADPKLGETNSISDALEEARQLSTYGVDLWHQWRIIECETVGKFAELDIQSIAHYLQSSDSTIREAAEAAYTRRGAEFPWRIVAQWPHVWSAVDHSEESLPAAQEAVTELLMENSVVNHSAPAAWLWENPSASSVPALCAVVERKLKVLPKVEPGEYLPQDYLWVLRALAKHSVFPECADTVIKCLTSEREEVAAALIHDIDSIPVSFSPQLLSLASKHDGWQKYAIAKWAVKRKEDKVVADALKSAGITTKTLKGWAN